MTPRTDNEVNEAFAKAIGWEWLQDELGSGWVYGTEEDPKFAVDLPDWCQDWPAFKRDVIGRMRKEGYESEIKRHPRTGKQCVFWHDSCYQEIVDDEQLRAGVESATEYLERRKG